MTVHQDTKILSLRIRPAEQRSQVFFQGTVRRQLPRKQGHLPVEIIIQHVILGLKAAVKGCPVKVCHVTQLCDGDLFQRLFH